MNTAPSNIIGQSRALAAALDHVSSLAVIDRPVLVMGERGTGKELVAERLHFLSSRWSNSLIKVNCGAITESLLESELFGHEAGAFTGATKTHIGRFERADGGTLFLDELGTMSLRLQEKLLRLIEYGEFERVGGQQTIDVDVRILAATNADLRTMADAGDFRWDLLDRLTFDVVSLPPLRERAEELRTSTRVSSISWIIRRIIFSGSSALSSSAFRLEFTMSDILEKIPMRSRSSLVGFGRPCPHLHQPIRVRQTVQSTC